MATTASSAANSTNAAIIASLSKTTQKDVTATEGAQDRFLKLLVTQMQNQDPLNPMDNAQVTSQIAQINTVTGIDKLNTSVTGLGDRLVGAQSLQASAMLGRHVLAPGKVVEYDGTDVPLTFDVASKAAQVKLSVIDANGKVVHAETLGSTDTGRHSVTWDGTLDAGGKAPQGLYALKVDAVDAKNVAVSVTTYGYGRVESVSLADGVKVNTNSLGAVAVTDVTAII